MKQHKTEHQISTVGQDDYPEYEGRVIIFDNGSITYSGLIVGFNRSVGVTIVDANNKDKYLFCFRGPVAPGHIKGLEKRDQAVFDYLVKAVEQGVYNDEEFQEAMSEVGGSSSGAASAAGCAYAQ